MTHIESPLSIVKYNQYSLSTLRQINFVYKSKHIGIKNPLRTNLTRGNLNAVGRSQLKYAACITLISGIATNSITAISCILSPKFNIFKVFRAFSRQSSPTNRLMLVRWWFNCSRFIKNTGVKNKAESSREAFQDGMAPALTPPDALLMGYGITEYLETWELVLNHTTWMIKRLLEPWLGGESLKHIQVKQISYRAHNGLRVGW